MSKSKRSFNPISPWADRFNTPTVDRLATGLPHATVSLFKHARRMLHESGLRCESVAWHGECWKWTVELRAIPSGDAMAILVPSPDNPQIALRVSGEFLATVPMRRLKKAVREGLDLAREPFDTNLAIWYLTSSALVHDLQDLVSRRVRHASRKTG
jgi:hypothetical protein